MKNETKNRTVVEGTTHHEADQHAADHIINTYTAIASGSGLIPVPFLDLVALAGIQMKMLYELGKLYHYKFDEHRAKSIVGVLTTSLPAGALIRTTGSLFKLIPFVGSLLGGISGFIYAAASTYALGKVFNMHFASGMSLLSFDTDKMKTAFQDFHAEYISTHTTTAASAVKN